jgi:protein TonB
MQSDAINWSVAIMLSLFIHSMIFFAGGARHGDKNAIVSHTPIVTRLSFNQSSDDLVPDEPRLPQKQRPVPIKKAEPEPEPEPEPALKKPAEANTVIQQQEAAEQTGAGMQATIKEHVKGKRASHSSDELLERERQLYLHKLMSHIESFKYYPRAARKRSLEGEVKVSFMLLDDGNYRQLKLDGKHSILVKATQSAMETATPFPAPPKDIKLPGPLEFTMSYSLTH